MGLLVFVLAVLCVMFLAYLAWKDFQRSTTKEGKDGHARQRRNQ